MRFLRASALVNTVAQTMAGPWRILTVLLILSCHSVGMVNCQLVFSQQEFVVEEDIADSVEICYSYSLEVGLGSAPLDAEIFTSDGTATGKLGIDYICAAANENWCLDMHILQVERILYLYPQIIKQLLENSTV